MQTFIFNTRKPISSYEKCTYVKIFSLDPRKHLLLKINKIYKLNEMDYAIIVDNDANLSMYDGLKRAHIFINSEEIAGILSQIDTYPGKCLLRTYKFNNIQKILSK